MELSITGGEKYFCRLMAVLNCTVEVMEKSVKAAKLFS